MSRRICPRCRQAFTETLTTCPHCGAKVFLPGHVFVGLVAFIAALMLYALWSAAR